DSKVDEVAVDERKQRLTAIGRGDRNVLPEAKGVVEIDPDIIGVVGAPLFVDPFELRPGHPVERPALGTLLAGRRILSGERRLAFGPVETGKMSASERRPGYTIRIDIHAP